MNIRDGIEAYYGSFGIKGLCAISSKRLFGVPRLIRAQPDGVRHPVYLRVKTSDVALFQDILMKGEYHVELPFSPHTIVDAGANCGFASIYYANQYPEANIIALEPEEANYKALLRNVAPYPNIVPVNAALWHKDGEVAMANAGKDWAWQVREGAGIRAITMRTLMAETGIDSIDLLKIDVEGAEKEIFSECDWIGRVRALVIELHDRIKPGCRAAVERATPGWSQYERGELTVLRPAA